MDNIEEFDIEESDKFECEWGNHETLIKKIQNNKDFDENEEYKPREGDKVYLLSSKRNGFKIICEFCIRNINKNVLEKYNIKSVTLVRDMDEDGFSVKNLRKVDPNEL